MAEQPSGAELPVRVDRIHRERFGFAKLLQVSGDSGPGPAAKAGVVFPPRRVRPTRPAPARSEATELKVENDQLRPTSPVVWKNTNTDKSVYRRPVVASPLPRQEASPVPAQELVSPAPSPSSRSQASAEPQRPASALLFKRYLQRPGKAVSESAAMASDHQVPDTSDPTQSKTADASHDASHDAVLEAEMAVEKSPEMAAVAPSLADADAAVGHIKDAAVDELTACSAKLPSEEGIFLCLRLLQCDL